MTDVIKLLPVEPAQKGMKILVSVAHHDDIEFGVGGSIAKWVQEGADVTYVIITDGGSGSNEVGTVREELAALRKDEQIAAAAEIGVHDVRFLNYPDGYLQPTLELRRDLTRIIREVKPFRVVCQDPTTVLAWDRYINHPDHRAAGEASLYAVFPSSETRPIFPELLEEGYEPHKVKELYLTLSLQPTHINDISDYMDAKIAALRHHVSQIGAGEQAENGALKWVRERNVEISEVYGLQYSESFRVLDFRPPVSPETNQDDEETLIEEAAVVESEGVITTSESDTEA